MEIQDILKWTDEQLLTKTGKHLDSLQKAILESVWDHQDYKEIALTHQRSYAHIKKEAWKLWKLLSDMLGEDIQKSNVCSVLEKAKLSNVSNSFDCVQIGVGHGNINICSEDKRSQSPPETSQTQNQSTIINLIEAPELTPFYNRTSELTTLKQWILEDHTRLITIYGLSGIGKSALTVKLIEEINSEFDYIIWKSLNNLPTLLTLQTELKDFFSKSQQTPLSTVIDYFRNSRCLVIIDDVQNIFKPDELAGQYLPEYEDYGKFFKQIATSFHQSCLILLSWTKPREIVTLEAENRPVRTLNLKGLGEEAIEILREKRLTDEENWSELITLYQGHPSWLNIIAATINELFNGSIAEFLADQNDIYLGDLHPFLKEYLERLAESEKQVIYWLSTQDEPVNIAQKTANLELSKPEFIQAIQSLIRRNLIEKVEGGGRSLFLLNPMFKRYVRWKLS